VTTTGCNFLPTSGGNSRAAGVPCDEVKIRLIVLDRPLPFSARFSGASSAAGLESLISSLAVGAHLQAVSHSGEI
jgi:hypothetical protein